MFFMKIYWWLDSNLGPLVSEASALPTNPQSLPSKKVFYHVFLATESENVWLYYLDLFVLLLRLFNVKILLPTNSTS